MHKRRACLVAANLSHRLLEDTCQQLEVIDSYSRTRAIVEHDNIARSLVDLRIALTEAFEVFGVSISRAGLTL